MQRCRASMTQLSMNQFNQTSGCQRDAACGACEMDHACAMYVVGGGRIGSARPWRVPHALRRENGGGEVSRGARTSSARQVLFGALDIYTAHLQDKWFALPARCRWYVVCAPACKRCYPRSPSLSRGKQAHTHLYTHPHRQQQARLYYIYIYIYTPLSQPAASRPTGTRTRRRPETGSLPEILDGPATRPPRRCALEASAAAGGSWAPSAVDWAVSAGQGSANSRRRRPAPRGAGGCRIGCRAPEGRWGPTPRRDAKAAAADRGRHTGARPRRPRRFGRR